MANVEPASLQGQDARRVCEVCGKPSDEIICEPCRIRIRGEELVFKKHRDKGEE